MKLGDVAFAEKFQWLRIAIFQVIRMDVTYYCKTQCKFMWHPVRQIKSIFPVGINMFKVNIRNTRIGCEICSKLATKTEQRQWCCSGVFINNFEHISHLVCFSFVNFEQLNAGWVIFIQLRPCNQCRGIFRTLSNI